jgi:hypothetical protein
MNSIQILTFSKQFLKFAKLDPFRNVQHDIEEAIDYCSDFFELKDEKSLMLIPLEWLNIEQIEQFPIGDLWKYDDVNSWLETEKGELKRKSTNDRIRFLKLLRGFYAVSWLQDGIPAIVLVDFAGNRFIGDGRGRINFAIGMDFKTVPVVLLTIKPEFEDQIVVKN